MTNTWPPPQDQPGPQGWAPPEAAPAVAGWVAPQPAPQNWPTPQNWPAPQAPPAQYAWPPPAPPLQPGSIPGYAPTAADDRGLAWILPVHRSGLAIAAGYVALFGIFIFVLAPVALVLGIFALRDLKRNPGRLGHGRAWFAIIAGGIMTVLALSALSVFLTR